LAEKEDIVFITQDLCCKQLAKSMGLNVEYLADKKQDYTGYQEIVCKNDTELAQWYEKIYTGTKIDDLLLNEYLILKDSFGNPLDSYKNTEEGLVKVNYNNFQSKMFGKVKAKDEYQKLAMDSLVNNKITMLRGTAGTGKSYLAIGYLFYLLDKHKIDKIIIFCNTVAASGAAKLGFYPGSRTEKLLDSQVGNFLSSKLGDRFEVEKMIADGYIELLPLADIRGYDTTGLNAGIYIQEAQNLDIELMKLALQRIGEDSICILDGDSDTQLDLPIYAGDNNGMRRVSEVFRGDPSYGEVTLKTIHRSHIATLADRM
jgi:predicted ribonuclease YlaK